MELKITEIYLNAICFLLNPSLNSLGADLFHDKYNEDL